MSEEISEQNSPHTLGDGQRHWQRVVYSSDVDVEFDDGKKVSGVSTDISVSGAFVQTSQPFDSNPVGSSGQLRVITKEGSMRFPCHVVRLDDSGVGIKFRNDQTAFGMFVTHELVQGHLCDINDIFSNVENSDATYDDAVAYIQQVMSCEGASLFLINDDGKIECRACSGPVDIKGITLEQGEGVVGLTISTGEARDVRTTSDDPQFSDKVDRASGFSTESIICAPLTINGETFGALEVVNLRGHDLFPGHGRVVLSTIASSAAMAIYTAKQNSMLAEHRQRALSAEVANKAKSEFLATMSHEIRTPLSSILGFADMLIRDELPAESLKRVERIAGSGNALLQIVNDILDITKLEAGKMEVETLDFHVANLIEETVAFMSVSGKANVKLDTAIAAEFPAYIHADPMRIRQVLLNLIGNALKFTHKGAVIVGADIDSSDGGEKLVFSVHDTGIGIAEEAIGGLFEKFTQADASVSRQYDGTGLGLAICRRLVELMGGDIGVESNLGEGSRFWFSIPYVPLEAPDLFDDTEAHDVAVEVSALRNLRILVAEDNDANQLIIANLLAHFGHDMRIVTNGRAALDVLLQEKFDLVLMDVRMPEMSGTDAAMLIRQMEGPQHLVPIIALTADAMTEHRKVYKEAGMNYVVTKPIDKVELATAINLVMDDDIHAFTLARPLKKSPVDSKSRQERDNEDKAVADFLASISDG